MAKIKNVLSRNIASKVLSVILISIAGILLYIGLQIYTDSMYQYYSRSFKKGQIAESDLLVSNSVDIYDEQSTEDLKRANARAVLPVFTYSLNNTFEVVGKFDRLNKAFAVEDEGVISDIIDADIYTALVNADTRKILSISYEVLLNILDRGYFSYSDLQKVDADNYKTFTIIKDSEEFVRETGSGIISDYNVQAYIDSLLIDYENGGLLLSESKLITQVVLKLLQFNVTYDEFMTEQRRQVAVDNTDSVYISFEKGQVILEKNRVITDEQLYLLSLLGNSSTITVSDIVGESVFILITMFFAMYLFCYYLDAEKLHSVQYLWIFTVGLVFTCVAAFFAINKATSLGISFVETFVPVCFVPILITMISGKRNLGYIASFIVGLIMSATPGSTYLTFIYCTLDGILCCIFVRFFNKRTDMFIQWLISFAITSVLTVLFIYIGSYSNREILAVLIGNAIHITATHILIAIILPILERIFNLPTVFMLNELGYGNNPLLTKLADAAPGTYSHSKQVSELSETASKAIGANAVLARVGGLYHDIGKTEHPEYFVENQSGTNKHEELNPNLSVSIIKSHVKVGADKAREAGLPAEIIDIIANHHGNDIIAYFYNEAKKQADEDDIVSSTDFSYSNSSIPHTKECAIVMLADSVEAAARTVSDPTAAKFNKLINTIVFGKIERGQLDKCDLSMKEIDTVRESFLKTLTAQYHNRIEYPDEEDEK